MHKEKIGCHATRLSLSLFSLSRFFCFNHRALSLYFFGCGFPTIARSFDVTDLHFPLREEEKPRAHFSSAEDNKGTPHGTRRDKTTNKNTNATSFALADSFFFRGGELAFPKAHLELAAGSRREKIGQHWRNIIKRNCSRFFILFFCYFFGSGGGEDGSGIAVFFACFEDEKEEGRKRREELS